MVHISKLHHVWQGYVQITQSLDHGRNGVNVLILVEVGLNHDVDHVENKTLRQENTFVWVILRNTSTVRGRRVMVSGENGHIGANV
jgi:hypothetical protein